MNQASIGASDAIAVVVSVVRAARHPAVLAAAARALGAISWSSYINKTRFAEAGAIPALLNVATEFAVGRPEVTAQYAAAVEGSLHALASLMLQRQNHLLLSDCDGPRRLVALCDSTEEMKALASGAMVLAVCAPTPEQRWDAYAEGRRIEVEEVHGLRALVRARQWVYGRAEAAAARAARAAHAKAQAVGASGMSTADAEAAGEAGLPPWLINPIRAMQMTQAQLDEEKKRLMAIGTAPSIALKQELVSREAHFVEVLTEVHADHIVTTSGKLQSLLYKVY